MKATSLSSKILKFAGKDSGLNAFGFENFEVNISGETEDGGSAERIPEEVREEIARRLKEIEEKEAIAEKKGYERGFIQGEKDGREIGKQSMVIIAQQLSKVLECISGVPDEIESRYSEVIKNLILQICQKVLQIEIDKNSEIIRRSLDLAFGAVNDAHKITLRLNPKDLALLEENLPEFIRGTIPENAKITWKADEEVMRGGCIVETDIQFIDATVESRIRQVEEILRDAE